MLFYFRTETHHDTNHHRRGHNRHGYGHTSHTHSHTVTYSAREQYLNTTMLLLNKPSSGDLWLEVGEYTYPFQIMLPPMAPTSFEHSIGHVRYSIYGTLDIPW